MSDLVWSKEDNQIVYRLPIENAIFAFNNCPLFYDGENDNQIYRVREDEREEFISNLINTLNREDEVGNTPTFKLFDESFQEMIEQGELGIEGGEFELE